MREAQSEKDPLAAWGFWLIAAFLWAVTAYAGWLSYERSALVAAAERFEQAPGKVEAAAVKARGGTGQVSVSIIVSYVVNDARHELRSNGLDGKVARGAGSGSASADAEALVARFSNGSPVVVYYDPEDPSVSALTPEIRGGRGLGGAIGSGALSLLFTLWLLRRRRED